MLLSMFAHSNQNFAIWYGNHVYPIFPVTIGRLIGLVPFSVFEVVLILGVLCIVCIIVISLANLCTSRGRARLWHVIKKYWATAVCGIINAVAIIILVFVLGAGINYNREPYAYHVGITVQESSRYELIQLYMILVEQAEILAPKIETDVNGHFVLNRDGMYDTARQAMVELNDLHGELGSYFPRAKGLIFSRLLLSNLNIGGFSRRGRWRRIIMQICLTSRFLLSLRMSLRM